MALVSRSVGVFGDILQSKGNKKSIVINLAHAFCSKGDWRVQLLLNSSRVLSANVRVNAPMGSERTAVCNHVSMSLSQARHCKCRVKLVNPAPALCPAEASDVNLSLLALLEHVYDQQPALSSAVLAS